MKAVLLTALEAILCNGHRTLWVQMHQFNL